MKRTIVALLLSVLMVAYGPIVTMTSAQAATDAKVQQLKQKALQEIDRRLASLKETQSKLEKDIQLENEALSDAMTRTGMSAVDVETTLKKVALEGGIKGKAMDSVKKVITKLTDLRKTVADSNTLADIQEHGKSVDSQYKLDQVTNVQGAVTKAVESLTGVFDKLKSTANDIQSRVSKLQSCTRSGGDTETKNQTCDKEQLTADDAETAKSAQSQMDNIATMLSTIGSVLMSAIMLLATLVTSFSSLLGGMGSLSSLGDVSGQSGLGSLTGLMGSFTAITSQLDIASGMGGNASTLMGGVTGLMSVFNF